GPGSYDAALPIDELSALLRQEMGDDGGGSGGGSMQDIQQLLAKSLTEIKRLKAANQALEQARRE
uniref:Beta-ketoacyl synthase,Beta-ketoacyl synthase n=1 Tax=Burkholderia ambifaria (strain ATCC BAA-244 / DSM 16087 / CCUG 44356 / LMG 19182 / AMMD) TaxID=339670 RepID=UPI0015F35234|nr:Chain A, Beta-ketoacyl synthase,Beta-ketoacyl synthase [Burkholderia ambifaria AMMD]6TDM_B Chain B, Beta-ketoacyl synthase,Beta-ketoacyl synthase [Burkholderia ambifaria AMMD]